MEAVDTSAAEPRVAKLPPPGVGISPLDVTLVGLDTGDREEHPLYDDTVHDEPDEEMAQSLGENGQLMAILLRKNGPLIEVIDGRDRTKAARLWNEANPGKPILLQWRLFRGKSDAELLDAMVVANEHRKDKPVIWKARMAYRMIGYGRSTADAARRFKVSPETIRSWLEALDAATPIQEAMLTGEFSANDAKAVTDLLHKDQVAVLELARENGTSLSNARDAVIGPAPRRAARSRATPSSTKRRGAEEIRSAIEDKDIPDDAFPWRKFGLWMLGEIDGLIGTED